MDAVATPDISLFAALLQSGMCGRSRLSSTAALGPQTTQGGPGLVFMIRGRLRIEAIDKTAAYDS